MDQDHLQSSREFLTNLDSNSYSFEWLIIISHIDELQTIGTSSLQITKHNVVEPLLRIGSKTKKKLDTNNETQMRTVLCSLIKYPELL